MSLSPTQAQLLDELATRALDAVRDQDRAAVDAATTTEPSAFQLENVRRLAQRAQDAEQQLIDAIHGLVVHAPDKGRGKAKRAWLTARP